MSNSRRTYFLCFLASFLLIGCAFAYAWGYRYVVRLSSEVSILKGQAVALFARQAALRERREELLLLSSLRSELEAYRVDRGSVVSLIESLEYAGRATGVSFRVALANAEAGSPGSLLLTWNATGPDQAVLRFLSLVELLPYDLSFERVIMTKQAREQSSLDVTLRIHRYEDR